MDPARQQRALLVAAILAGAGIAAACRGPRTAGEPGAATSAAPAEPAALAGDVALALAPPVGNGPADRRVRQLQQQVRRAPEAANGWVALGHGWLQRVRETFDESGVRHAEVCAARALALAPGAVPARALRAAVLLDRHRFGEAHAEAEAALRAVPDERVALGVLADALVELGRYDEAVATTDRLMRLKPGLSAYTRASYLLWLRGHEAAAIEAARRAVDAAGGEREPRAFALVQAALLFWHRGDHEGAAAGFQAARAAFPDYPPALVGLGRVALARGDAASAAALLERAFRAQPLAETAWLLGDARTAAGDEAGAAHAYGEVIRLGRAGERRVLARFLATKGRDAEQAVRLAEEERRVRPDVYSDDTLAWALFRAGRAEEAQIASARALRLGTPDASLLYHAGAIRLAAGDRVEGRALVARALAVNPAFDWTGAAEARRLLEGGGVARETGAR